MLIETAKDLGFDTTEATMDDLEILCSLAHYGQRSGCDLRDYEFWCLAEANKRDSYWIEVVQAWEKGC